MAVDMSRVQRSVLDDAIQTAKAVQQRGDKEAAAAAWESAARKADNFASMASTSVERERRNATAIDIRELAQKLRTPSQSTSHNNSTGDVDTSTDEFRQAARQLIHRSGVRFQDIAGQETTTAEIQSAFALPLAKAPAGVHIPKAGGLLFYGPPGCGKTLLAAAVSNGLDATFFSVKVSDLLSRYYGDSPKLVQALYAEARSHGNSVIFLDECDALAPSRSAGDSSADRRLLVSLLTELDGLTEKDTNSNVITIAATNRPWDLEEAFLSRFQKSVYIPLPDTVARKRIVELHLQEKGYQVQISEAEMLQQTQGLSGREISHLCSIMIQVMIQESNPNLVAIATKGRAAIEDYEVKVQPIRQSHLEHVRSRIQPRTSAASIELFRRWSEEGSGQ
jgi:katanin p60 ATPase-containing subunit A1